MTIDESLAATAAIAKENTEGIKELLITTREHTKQIDKQSRQIENHTTQIDKQSAQIDKQSAQIDKQSAHIDKQSAQIDKQSARVENHFKQLEIDGQHIRQLAMIVHDHQGEIDKMMNGINALLETVALHETRIHGIEGNQ